MFIIIECTAGAVPVFWKGISRGGGDCFNLTEMGRLFNQINHGGWPEVLRQNNAKKPGTKQNAEKRPWYKGKFFNSSE
jgi:hypothetical protein